MLMFTFSYVGVNLQKKKTRLQKVYHFFIWTRCGWKLLNNWINFKVQMYHTSIVQNVDTWTWRHFRSYVESVPSLFFYRNAEPFLRYAIVIRISDYGLVTHIRLGTTTRQEDAHWVSGHSFEGQGHYDP